MNSSIIEIFSKVNLTNRFVDVSNVYVLPLSCFFGILTSILSVFVSLKRDKANAKVFDFIFINSSIDLTFLLIQSFIFVFRCGIFCSFQYTYPSVFYKLYIFLFIGYALVTSQILFNIYVAYDRFRIFSGKLTLSQKSFNIYIVYAICGVTAILTNSITYSITWEVTPFGVFIPEINSTHSELLWTIKLRNEFQIPILKELLSTIMVIEYPLLFMILCAVSITVCIRFRLYLKSKQKLIKKNSNLSNFTFLSTFNKLVFIFLYYVTFIIQSKPNKKSCSKQQLNKFNDQTFK